MAYRRRWVAQFKSKGKEAIPRDALDITFSRSSGPGGQNVNKVNTKATLRLLLAKASFLPSFVHKNLTKTSYYTASSHAILLASSVHRTQHQNVEDAIQRLHGIVVQAARLDLEGETSDAQRVKVRNLERVHKQRVKTEETARKQLKASRKAVWD